MLRRIDRKNQAQNRRRYTLFQALFVSISIFLRNFFYPFRYRPVWSWTTHRRVLRPVGGIFFRLLPYSWAYRNHYLSWMPFLLWPWCCFVLPSFYNRRELYRNFVLRMSRFHTCCLTSIGHMNSRFRLLWRTSRKPFRNCAHSVFPDSRLFLRWFERRQDFFLRRVGMFLKFRAIVDTLLLCCKECRKGDFELRCCLRRLISEGYPMLLCICDSGIVWWLLDKVRGLLLSGVPPSFYR